MNPDVEELVKLSRRPLNGVIEAEVTGATSEPVRLANLVDEIAELILRFINLPGRDLATLLAVWIAGTYVYERFEYYGYIALRSPTPRCGKSRLLKLLARVAKGNPTVNSNPTSAAIFRSKRKVLVLDEVDQLRNKDRDQYGDVIAVLNAGFERGGTVERVDKVGGSFEVRAFEVFGPKLLAGIEGLADTLSDRAFILTMERTSGRMPRLTYRKLNRELERLRQRLADWAAMFIENVTETYDNLPDELPQLRGFDDRFQDIAEPLLVVASLADDEEPPDGELILPRLLRGLQAVAGRRERSSREEQLLALLDIVEERLGLADETFIETRELIGACNMREELAWIEDSSRKLAGLLKPFELFPKSTGSVRGYLVNREWIETWRARYGDRPV